MIDRPQNTLQLPDIQSALRRIKGYVNVTPVFFSARLNEALGHNIYFKAENLQRVGAFKARGAMNTLLWLRDQNALPHKVIAYSSGNHAQAVSWAATAMGIEAEIFMPKNVSKVKLLATKGYGATVTLCEIRQEAEDLSTKATASGAFLLPPFDHDQVICGQGTACLEALNQIDESVHAVFAPCGGGGLLSGTLIAAKGSRKDIYVAGAEPLQANDAARTLKTGQIFRWAQSPQTIADGAMTLSVTPRTLNFLKQLDELYEIPESEIVYWTQWICHLLKLHCEPTSALGMAAARRWLGKQTEKKTVLVILSGGNMDPSTAAKIWSTDYLTKPP